MVKVEKNKSRKLSELLKGFRFIPIALQLECIGRARRASSVHHFRYPLKQVMEWMLDIQLGRRNLSPIQRIAVAEKYRPIYEKMAKENLSTGGRNGGLTTQNKPLTNLSNPSSAIDTTQKLANMAGVSRTTYRMGAKVLNSDNEDVKNRVLSGETSISAGYREHSPLDPKPVFRRV